MRVAAWCTVVALAVPARIAAAPPTATDIARLCTNAEDQAHCGRLIEATLLPRLKQFARRDGDELRIELLPDGSTVFRDAVNIIGARSYAVWDYVDDLETVVLFATRGDRTEFWWVQRRGGGEFRIPSEPVLAPGHQRFATADFCAQACENEVAIWRVEAGNVRKELAFAPPQPWREASVGWKSRDTVVIEYVAGSETAPRTMERRLGDAAWIRAR